MDFLSHVVLQECYPILDALLRHLSPRDIASLMDAVDCREYPSVAIRELNPLLHLGYPRSHVDAIMGMSRAVLILGAGVEALWDECRYCTDDHNSEYPCYTYHRSIAPYSDISLVYLMFIPRDVNVAIEWLSTVGYHLQDHMWCYHHDDGYTEEPAPHQFDEIYPDTPMVKMSSHLDFYGYNCAVHYGMLPEEWRLLYTSESTESNCIGFRYMDLKRDPLKVQTAVSSPLNDANGTVSIKVDVESCDTAYIPIGL